MVNFGGYAGWFDTVAGRAARSLAFSEMEIYCVPRVLSGELLNTTAFTDGGVDYVGVTACYVCEDQTAFNFNNLDEKWMQRTGESEVGGHGSANPCTP